MLCLRLANEAVQFYQNSWKEVDRASLHRNFHYPVNRGAVLLIGINVQMFSSLNVETSPFAYNYFLIEALAAWLIVNEVHLDVIPAKNYFFLSVY